MLKSTTEAVKNNALDYIIIIILGVIFLSLSVDIFLIYALMVILIRIDSSVNFLRKMIRVLNFTTETKIITIARKLKINDYELGDSLFKDSEDTKFGLTREQKESLRKDLVDLLS